MVDEMADDETGPASAPNRSLWLWVHPAAAADAAGPRSPPPLPWLSQQHRSPPPSSPLPCRSSSGHQLLRNHLRCFRCTTRTQRAVKFWKRTDKAGFVVVLRGVLAFNIIKVQMVAIFLIAPWRSYLQNAGPASARAMCAFESTPTNHLQSPPITTQSPCS